MEEKRAERGPHSDENSKINHNSNTVKTTVGTRITSFMYLPLPMCDVFDFVLSKPRAIRTLTPIAREWGTKHKQEQLHHA